MRAQQRCSLLACLHVSCGCGGGGDARVAAHCPAARKLLFGALGARPLGQGRALRCLVGHGQQGGGTKAGAGTGAACAQPECIHLPTTPQDSVAERSQVRQGR